MSKRRKRMYSVDYDARYDPGNYGEIQIFLIDLPHPFSRPIVLETCFDYVDNNGNIKPVIFLDPPINIRGYNEGRIIASSLSLGQKAVLELIADKICKKLPDCSRKYKKRGEVSVATNAGTSIGLEASPPIRRYRGRIQESPEDF